jgi:pimeloyl-ACP methyl ester carboxylesterase
MSGRWLVPVLLLAFPVLTQPVVVASSEGLIELDGADTLEPVSCEAFGFLADGVECARLTVDERHGDPGVGQLVLPVAVIRSTTAEPAADPIVYLPGGPGASGLDVVGAWIQSPLRRDREIVLFDPRGTGAGEPSLACRGLDEFAVFVSLDPDMPEIAESWRTTAAECRDYLVESGIDLAAYSTAKSAHDVEALRRALGVEAWNLYGVSYGTRLGLEVLRQHPEGVRSAVLDSVLPPTANPYEEAARNLIAARDAVRAACVADAACAARFGDIDALFEWAENEWSGSLRFASVTGTNGAHYAMVLGDHTPEFTELGGVLGGEAAWVPAQLEALALGNTAFLEFALIDTGGVIETVRLQVECSERVLTADPARIEADRAAHPEAAAVLDLRPELNVCADWGAEPAPSDQRAAVASDAAVLLVAGELDPLTPVRDAEAAAATLPNARLAVIVGAGHATSLDDDCAISIVSAFLEAPRRPVDDGCAGAARVDFVTDLAASPGLARLAFDVVGPLTMHPERDAVTPLLVAVGVALVLSLAFGAIRAVRGDRSALNRTLMATNVLWLGLAIGVAAIWWQVLEGASSSVLLFGVPAAFGALLWIPWIAAGATLLLAALVIRAWLRRDASRLGRALQTIAVAGPVAATWIALAYGLAGPG